MVKRKCFLSKTQGPNRKTQAQDRAPPHYSEVEARYPEGELAILAAARGSAHTRGVRRSIHMYHSDHPFTCNLYTCTNSNSTCTHAICVFLIHYFTTHSNHFICTILFPRNLHHPFHPIYSLPPLQTKTTSTQKSNL